MLDTPKWFSDCESVNSVVSINNMNNISRDYNSGAKMGGGGRGGGAAGGGEDFQKD